MPVPTPPAPRIGRGRPRKFGRPSRPVTVTLPDDVVAQLQGIDMDLGRAIVRLTERRSTAKAKPVRAAEIANYGNHAVIVVAPVRSLKRLHGVELVPIGNGRALISLAPTLSVSQFELDVRDAASAASVSVSERRALNDIANILQQARGRSRTKLRERTIIVLEFPRRSSAGA